MLAHFTIQIRVYSSRSRSHCVWERCGKVARNARGRAPAKIDNNPPFLSSAAVAIDDFCDFLTSYMRTITDRLSGCHRCHQVLSHTHKTCIALSFPYARFCGLRLVQRASVLQAPNTEVLEATTAAPPVDSNNKILWIFNGNIRRIGNRYDYAGLASYSARKTNGPHGNQKQQKKTRRLRRRRRQSKSYRLVTWSLFNCRFDGDWKV